jgi:phage terminase large subunit
MLQVTPTIKPTLKQHEAYECLQDKETRFLLFGGGAEGGKSWLGAEWLLTNCYRYPGTKWFIGRNELTRLMASSYATFRKVCQYHNIPSTDWKFNGQYHYIEFVCKLPDCPTYDKFDDHGSRIDLLDFKFNPSDPMFQRFGSTEYTGGWIEEAGEVHFLAFDVLKSRIGRWNNNEYGLNPAKMLLTCNPEQNWLYRIFYKPWKNDTLRIGYAFIQALYKDNPYTAKEAEARLEEIIDPVLRSRLKLGLWEYASGDSSLLTYDDIVDLFTNVLAEESQTEKYFSADVARYGSDKVTMGRWKGFNLNKITWKQKRGIDQTAQDVREEVTEGQIPYSHSVIDDDGVGGGVVDLNRGMKGFVGNSSPREVKSNPKTGIRKDNYKNLRSQCGFMLAARIKAHEVAITAVIDEATKEMIIEDLQQLKKKETPLEAPLQLIPKDEIKEALGRSPDFSDMMLMRMIFDLEPVRTNTQTNYDVGGVKPYLAGTLA